MLKMGDIPSKLVLDLVGSKIEQTSGVKLDSRSCTKAPVEKWIPETEMARTKPIKLRTAAETKHDGVIELQQFNPSFFLANKNAISCRAPGCKETTSLPKPSDNQQHIKQDLFLCEIHRATLANFVSKRCEKESINVASFKHEDFHGYTHLIGDLEKAFMHLVKKPTTLNMPQNSLYPNSNLVLAEVFLNSRNFLIITHALLNPNDDNVEVVLPALFVILKEIMNQLRQSDLLERLVRALREVMNIILECYGIIYAWVKLDNTGAQVGGGAVLFGGLAAAAYFALAPVPAIVTGVVALVARNFFGSGAYQWHQQQHEVDRRNQRVREYQQFMRQQFGQAVPCVPLFHVPANVMGDLACWMCRIIFSWKYKYSLSNKVQNKISFRKYF